MTCCLYNCFAMISHRKSVYGKLSAMRISHQGVILYPNKQVERLLVAIPCRFDSCHGYPITKRPESTRFRTFFERSVKIG